MACGGSSPNWTANTWTQLGECFAAASAIGDSITVTANLSATSQLNWTAPVSATLQGQGSLSIVGGNDITNISDDNASNTPLLNITINGSGVFRLHGLTIKGGSGGIKDLGLLTISGPGTVAIHHVHLNMDSYSDPGAKVNKSAMFGNQVYGVLDHSILDFGVNGSLYFLNGSGTDGAGNETWASNTDFGKSSFFFIETNQINGKNPTVPSRVSDCYSAGRVVIRFNTLAGSAGPEVHATGHAADDRGCRAQETYHNHYTLFSGQTVPAYDMHDASSGPSLIWGNVVDSDTLKNGIVFNVTRKNNDTYNQTATPAGWGYAGPSYQTNTVDTAGTAVTRISGTNFNTSWTAGTMILINGVSYIIASVGSINALTLTATAGTQSSVGAVLGSSWDQGSDVLTGYACIDQPGRGKGDLITGTFPTKVNDTTGTIAWPNQALEPAYVWMNVFTPAAGWGGSFYVDTSGGRVVADRDYYQQASGENLTLGTPFTGSTGVGWGPRINRPSNCTTGVAYWSTDQGSWNYSGGGGQGVLDKCTSTNTWTDSWYAPYPYPHSLATGSLPRFSALITT